MVVTFGAFRLLGKFKILKKLKIFFLYEIWCVIFQFSNFVCNFIGIVTFCAFRLLKMY